MVLEALGDLPGTVVVTYGDVPLLRTQTLAALVGEHAAAGNAVTVLTARVPDPTGYGRIVRDDGGSLAAIVEDATPPRRSGPSTRSTPASTPSTAPCWPTRSSGSPPTTPGRGVPHRRRRPSCAATATRSGTVLAADADGGPGRQRPGPARPGAARLRRPAASKRWMRAGVTIVDPATTWIDVDVDARRRRRAPARDPAAGADATSRPGAEVGPDCTLIDTVGRRGRRRSVTADAEPAEIGPGARSGRTPTCARAPARPRARSIGAFVETKNAEIGEGSKVPHLSYVGDAEIGEGTNIGAATVFVNYDGVAKHRTDGRRPRADRQRHHARRAGDGRRRRLHRGRLGHHRRRAAGRMGVGRGRQRNIEGWVARQRPGTASAAAAGRARAGGPSPAGPARAPAEDAGRGRARAR